MISILIPTFNYSVFSLVETLHQQALKASVIFEIIVIDDCSPKESLENLKINDLKFANYTVLSKNIGRSAIRNKLAQDAKYNVLLFLDADTQVISKTFIENYLNALTNKTQIIYGGILYQKKKPNAAKALRWVYGKKREALSVSERRKLPYLRFLTLNFLIKKNVFQLIKFNENIPNLRHEDTLFAVESKKNKINVQHIENPVIHVGLESSIIFLKKSKESIDALHSFIKNKIINENDTKLTKKAAQLSYIKISFIFYGFYKLFKNMIERNLLSKNPSLFLFDLYRLGYYLEIKK